MKVTPIHILRFLTFDQKTHLRKIVYEDNGDVKSQEVVYEDGTGTIIFHDDGTFTWHEDQSETGNDMVFKWSVAKEKEL